MWSVVCLFVKHGHRRKGVAGKLLETAVDYAREQRSSRGIRWPTRTRASDRACLREPWVCLAAPDSSWWSARHMADAW